MAKEKIPTQKIENRKHVARSKRETEQQRQILIALAVIAGLIVLILIGGAVYTYSIIPNQPVAKVNGVAVSRANYQKRVLYERYQLDEQSAMLQNQYQQLSQSLNDSPELLKSLEDQANQQLNQIYMERINTDRNTLDLMTEELLVAAEAAQRNITVSDQEIADTYNEIAAARAGGYTEARAQETVTARQNATATAALFTPTPTPEGVYTPTIQSPQPTPTINVLTGDTLTQAVKTWEETMQTQTTMTPADLRELVRHNLLRQKVYEAIGSEIPTTAEQVHARHILVATEEEAKTVKDRLTKGEDFAAVAAEVSTDTSSAGGDLGWFPSGAMIQPFNDAAFSLPVNQISDPIQSDFGWHIIQVLEKGDRELDAGNLARAKNKAYTDWLRETRITAVVDLWSDKDVPPDPNNPFANQSPANTSSNSTPDAGTPSAATPTNTPVILQ